MSRSCEINLLLIPDSLVLPSFRHIQEEFDIQWKSSRNLYIFSSNILDLRDEGPSINKVLESFLRKKTFDAGECKIDYLAILDKFVIEGGVDSKIKVYIGRNPGKLLNRRTSQILLVGLILYASYRETKAGMRS